MLATSRSRLLVPSSRSTRCRSVRTRPTTAPDAVELFLARRRRRDGSPRPGQGRRVCRGLDGMALAIELAAARSRRWGSTGWRPAPGDRLDLLTGGSRVDGRHRSLRSALDWSHALLGEPERALLRRVSVIAGPFSSIAAAQMLGGWDPVAADQVPALLARLADESLLAPRPRPRWGRATPCSRPSGSTAPPARRCRRDGCRARSPPALVPGGCRAAGRPGTVGPDGDTWRAAFDEVSLEVRRCLPWARHVPDK